MRGCLALLLASIGIYGVVAYTRADVVARMLRKGLTPGFGWIGDRSQLYHVNATDALTFSAVPGLMILIAACAAYLPSRRAARIDPMLALRHD